MFRGEGERGWREMEGEEGRGREREEMSREEDFYILSSHHYVTNFILSAQ